MPFYSTNTDWCLQTPDLFEGVLSSENALYDRQNIPGNTQLTTVPATELELTTKTSSRPGDVEL